MFLHVRAQASVAAVISTGALFALLAASPVAAQERPSSRSLSDAQIQEMLDGEVIAEVTRDGSNNRAEMVCVIDAEPDAVWEVVMDYAAYDEWFPDQVESRVVEDNGNTNRLYGETRVPVLRNRTYEFIDESRTETVDGETHYIDTWTYVPDSGNLESTDGFWYVEPLDGHPGKTLVRMVVYADIGMWVPQALINWGTRRMLPGIAEGIQEQCDAR